ncbi:MAG: hypothetical protein ABSG64_02970 [Solirubrobacteraceae bacterium]|jgi:hypothetical protein
MKQQMNSTLPTEAHPRSTPRAMRLLAAALAGGLGAFACPIGPVTHTPTPPAATAPTLSAGSTDRTDQ